MDAQEFYYKNKFIVLIKASPICYGLNVYVSPPKFNVENLMFKVMVLGGGTFQRCLGCEGRVLTNVINVLIRDPERSLTPSAM